MIVDMPELAQIDLIEQAMETAKNVKQYIEARDKLDFIFEQLRKEIAEEE